MNESNSQLINQSTNQSIDLPQEPLARRHHQAPVYPAVVARSTVPAEKRRIRVPRACDSCQDGGTGSRQV